MPVKALFMLCLISLCSSLGMAQSRNSVLCNVIETWYTQDSSTNLNPTFKPNNIIPLDAKSRTGKMELPVGTSGEFKASIFVTSTDNLDCLHTDTFLMKKNHEGAFLPVAAETRIGCSGDSFNDKLATIDTQNSLRNIHLEQAKVLYGIDLLSSRGVNDLEDDDYAGMVKSNLIAPSTLSKVEVNCSILKLKK